MAEYSGRKREIISLVVWHYGSTQAFVISLIFGDDARILREHNFQSLLLANMISPLDLALLSPILDSLTTEFGATPANIGLLMSAFTAPAVVVIPVVCYLSDRIGRKPILLSGLLLMGIAGAAVALTTDFRVGLGLRLLQGTGGAAIEPIIITSIGDIYDGTRKSSAQGFLIAGSGLAQTLLPPLAGLLVGIVWYYPLLLYVLAVPVAGMVYLWFDEPAPHATAEANATNTSGRKQKSPTLRDLIAYRRVQAVILIRCLPPVVWLVSSHTTRSSSSSS
jgi:MFS family permease